MISLKTFASKTKAMGSSFMKSIYIFNIFHHLRAVNESKSKVWKGKNPGPSGVKGKNDSIELEYAKWVACDGNKTVIFDQIIIMKKILKS